ncbi:hypothetical protein CCH79_00019074 [Gambusia affinis]|uniref:B30.2/SPRY domain-containing protein n=1 Tax=Gambusia affinis TaxID=33528 RepID=A0A315VPL2_GAMAF|nr:hypothetical protein CCH79_00019074 [Gambusia affinis]
MAKIKQEILRSATFWRELKDPRTLRTDAERHGCLETDIAQPRESLTGRCYWEVKWAGSVCVAVAYKNVSRAGGPVSSRLGVYLDHRAGLLSFYSVSETMTLIHRVQTRFTRPLHAGRSSYVSLSDATTLSQSRRLFFFRYFLVRYFKYLPEKRRVSSSVNVILHSISRPRSPLGELFLRRYVDLVLHAADLDDVPQVPRLPVHLDPLLQERFLSHRAQ